MGDPTPQWPPNLSSHSLLQPLGGSRPARGRLDGLKTQGQAASSLQSSPQPELIVGLGKHRVSAFY